MEHHAKFSIVVDNATTLVILDEGPWNEFMSVTNDAEWVVRQLSTRLAGRVLLYFDSEGELDQLLVRDGEFAGFRRWNGGA